MAFLRIVDKFFEKFCEWSALFFGCTMIIAAFIQVFTRSVLHNPLTWTEAVCRYSMVWFAFTAAGLGVKKGAHVRVDILYNALDQKKQYWLQKFVDLVCVLFCGILGYSGVLKCVLQWNQMTPSLPISYGWVYLACPVFAVIGIFYALLQLFDLQDKL